MFSPERQKGVRMMNLKERQEQLNTMKVADLKALAAEYQIKVSGKKADIIQQLLNFEQSAVRFLSSERFCPSQ